MQSYTLGETINLELGLRDKSGIGRVIAVFTGCSTRKRPTGRSIILEGEGGGRTRADVNLSVQITESSVPGEYSCDHIEVYDTLGNYTLYYPEIGFRIEQVPGDHEGPELIDWRFKSGSTDATGE
jgi:hypothetical protein